MYSIYADGVCIYNDVLTLESTKALNPKLILEDNGAGSLTITIPPTNTGYSTITRLTTDISVQKDGEELWSGRVLQEDKDFYNNRVLYCEGDLAFFNDSTQPPAEYTGLTVRAYLEKLLAVHNAKVPANRQFTLGAVTVRDNSFPAYRTNYEKTIEILNALVEAYGGHLRVRKADGVRYLDYLADYPDTCSQVIQFGSNLIDFTRKWDSTEFASVIVPLGGRLEESPIEALDAYLTVESVNQGSMYVQSETAVAAYGWIEKTVTWDDVTDPAVLLEKAKSYLADLQFDNMELELSALDLHYLDVNCEAVKLLDEIRVISRPHGLDRLFPVTKLEIPLDSPEQTQFKLGDSVKTNLTSVNNQTSAAIIKKIEGLPKAHTLLKEAKENATQIMNMATTGYITITKDEHGSEELYISNVQDYTKADKFWKWNMNGLGYSKDGGTTYEVAITMDGAIVADFITAGVLNGDVIRAGRIQDVKNNNYWNLDTGEFQLSASAKVGESTVASVKNVNDMDGSFDQQKVFNRLTDNGKAQGIYLQEKKLYINAEYIATGVLRDSQSNVVFDLNNGKLTMKKGSINLGNGNFTVDEEGNVFARNGTFAGKLVGAKISGDLLPDPDSEGGWIRGCGISVGGDDYETGKGNFYVSSNGDVTMKGSISLTGNITWSASNSPVKVLYAPVWFNKPKNSYDSYPDGSKEFDRKYDWHKTFYESDYYASYSYDGGSTWTNPIKLQGKDGENGKNGSNAEVTRANIVLAMLKSIEQDGLYTTTIDGEQCLGINATAIRTGTIDAGSVYLADNNGGFCSGRGYDGVYDTYGAKMYGSDGEYGDHYVIATNAGTRMQAGSNSFYVTDGSVVSSIAVETASDRRLKNSIVYNLEKYKDFFLALKPCSYRFNGGTSGRSHIGYIAQDIEEAIAENGITSTEFAGFIKSVPGEGFHIQFEDEYRLRYTEFIALNTYMIQCAWAEINRLNDKLQKMQGEDQI